MPEAFRYNPIKDKLSGETIGITVHEIKKNIIDIMTTFDNKRIYK